MVAPRSWRQTSGGDGDPEQADGDQLSPLVARAARAPRPRSAEDTGGGRARPGREKRGGGAFGPGDSQRARFVLTPRSYCPNTFRG